MMSRCSGDSFDHDLRRISLRSFFRTATSGSLGGVLDPARGLLVQCLFTFAPQQRQRLEARRNKNHSLK